MCWRAGHHQALRDSPFTTFTIIKPMPGPYTWREVKQEITMRKIILTLLGAALIAGATTEIAYAKEHHHVRNARQFTSEQFRNSNAAVIPALPQTESGGMGGWGSMTGFN
jgi:hypothetical protein